MIGLHDDVAIMFAALSTHETGGVDPLTFAAQYHVDRWAGYEQERRERREIDASFAGHERERWTRANANRKRKRRGLHLTNADRIVLADRLRAGVAVDEVVRETGVSAATAGTIGQLVLFDASK